MTWYFQSVISIDLESAIPLTEQIVHGIDYAIASGQLAPGDPLPPIRQLASDLGIHFNTVARAYRALEANGMVRSSRGRGTRVRAAQRPPAPEGEARLRYDIRTLLANARLNGLDRMAIERLLDDELDRLWTPAPAPSARRSTPEGVTP